MPKLSTAEAGCCNEFECAIPAFRCDCQQDCYWASRHQTVANPDLDPGDVEDPDTYYVECIDPEGSGKDGYGPCDPDINRLPDIAPLNVQMFPTWSSSFPLQPGFFFNIDQSINDCYAACTSDKEADYEACNTTYDGCLVTCETSCAGADDETACINACVAGCKSAKAGCYGVIYGTVIPCCAGCIDDKHDFKKTAGQIISCQDNDTETLPNDGLEFSRCLSYAAKLYIDAAWSRVQNLVSAFSDCISGETSCWESTIEDTPTGDCSSEEFSCKEHAYATFLRGIQELTEQWSMMRADCMRDWLAARGYPQGWTNPRMKLASCEWQWLGPRKKDDLTANSNRFICEADMWDCNADCPQFDNDVFANPGTASCAALCNNESVKCMWENVRRARVADRIDTCRHMWKRASVGNDQSGEWCNGMCDALAVQCEEMFNTAKGDCEYTCCGQADFTGCIDGCDDDTKESQTSLPLCAQAFQDCLGYVNDDGDTIGCGPRNPTCWEHCLDTYADCVFVDQGDWSVCQLEGRTHNYGTEEEPDFHNYCKEIGCGKVFPDCPSCHAWDNDDNFLLGLNIDYFMFNPTTAPLAIMTGCD